MQKFTVFTILLTASILLIVGDLLLHDYLTQEVEVKPSTEVSQLPVEELELEPELIVQPIEVVEDELLTSVESTQPVELSEEPKIFEDLFVAVGFKEPALKTALFSGYLFQFIPVIDQVEASNSYWNLFEGQTFVGSITEMDYPSQTASLQAYLSILEKAKGLTAMGEVNEVNLYGDASFYFNHKVKQKTVHLVIRKGESLFAFEYDYAFHDTMKNAFDFLE